MVLEIPPLAALSPDANGVAFPYSAMRLSNGPPPTILASLHCAAEHSTTTADDNVANSNFTSANRTPSAVPPTLAAPTPPASTGTHAPAPPAFRKGHVGRRRRRTPYIRLFEGAPAAGACTLQSWTRSTRTSAPWHRLTRPPCSRKVRRCTPHGGARGGVLTMLKLTRKHSTSIQPESHIAAEMQSGMLRAGNKAPAAR